MRKFTEPAVAKSPARTEYGPLVASSDSTVSGMMKCMSEKPWPWPWLTMLIGAPSMEKAMSVPWSASKPRRKYCCALPPPACWTEKRPGTASMMFSVLKRGRSISSAWLVFESDAALAGGTARSAMTSVD